MLLLVQNISPDSMWHQPDIFGYNAQLVAIIYLFLSCWHLSTLSPYGRERSGFLRVGCVFNLWFRSPGVNSELYSHVCWKATSGRGDACSPSDGWKGEDIQGSSLGKLRPLGSTEVCFLALASPFFSNPTPQPEKEGKQLAQDPALAAL